MRHSKRMLKQIRRALLAGLALSIALHLLVMVLPLAAVEVFRLAVPQGSSGALAVLTGIAAAAAAAAAAMASARHVVLVRAGLWLDHELGHVLLENGMRRGLSASDIAGHGIALGHVRGLMTAGAAAALLDATCVPLIVVAATLAAPLLGLVAGATAGLLIAIAAVQSRHSARLSAAAEEARDANRRDWAHRADMGHAWAALGLTDGVAAQWELRNRAFVGKTYDAAKRSGLTSAIALAAGSFGLVAFLSAGAWLLMHGKIDAAVLAASALLMSALVLLLGRLVARAGEIAAGLMGLRQLEHLAAKAATSRPANTLPGTPQEIVLDNAVFAYPGSAAAAVRGVSLVLRRGECLAITGAAGSGKTALARLMAGAAIPTSGAATLDGIAIADVQRGAPSPSIGFIAEDPALLEGTVLDNIARFRRMSRDVAMDAAQRAGVHDILAALPKGYDTPAGHMGGALSQRERRAVAFARALAAEPAFVVIDTPEQGLDAYETRRLEQVLIGLMTTGTGIALMTNDAALLALASRVAALDRGSLRSLAHARAAPPSAAYQMAVGY